MKRLSLRQMRRHTTAISTIALVAGLVAATASGTAVDASGLLHLVPALVLVLVLLIRCYPGERLILRLRDSARRSRRRRTGARALAPRVRVAALVPRGGLLLGRSLAVRPPPAALLPS